MNLDVELRKLAQTVYWQGLYRASLECSNISLFENTFNYSGLQVRFLYWLSVYKKLYEELSTFEDDSLTEKVIKDIDRCDAYLIHRNKKYEYQWKQHRQTERESRLKNNRKKGFKNPGKESVINVDLRREQ